MTSRHALFPIIPLAALALMIAGMAFRPAWLDAGPDMGLTLVVVLSVACRRLYERR